MATIRNVADLRKILLSKMARAMNDASEKILADTKNETEGFYEGTSPRMYVRTGALGKTPEVTNVTATGDEMSFEIKLNQDYTYTTGDNPSMAEVLDLANYGIPYRTSDGELSEPTLGKKYFWERAENKMQSDLDSALSRYFK